MEISSFFNSKNGDRKYNATHWANYFKPLFKTGVFNGDLQVTANGSMSVTVEAGYAWLEGYGYNNTEPLVIDLEVASGNLNRYDAIKIRLDLSERTIKAYADKGGNATEPTKPSNERSDTVYELTIAEVYVAAGTTVITPSMITDTRMDASKCGWVVAAVDQIDFSQIDVQFKAYFEEMKNQINTESAEYFDQQKKEFEEWFETIKSLLEKEEAGELLVLVQELQNRVDALEDFLYSATINVTTDEEAMFGQEVTCSTGSEVMTATFSDAGECTFKVKSSGKYTISCGEIEETVNVTMLLGSVYDVELSSVPKSTINVTTNEFQGQEITLSLAGSDTVTGTFSDDGVCSFKVKELGVYTVICGDVSETVTVSAYGALYTVELSSAPKATINVSTTSEELFGLPVTCTDGVETLTSTFSDTGTCSFKVSNVATYTISCGEYSTTVSVTDLTATYEVAIETLAQLVNYTMLYDEGDECEDVTGGWIESPSGSYGECIKNETYLTSKSTSGAGFAWFFTNNQIPEGYVKACAVTEGIIGMEHNGTPIYGSYGLGSQKSGNAYFDKVMDKKEVDIITSGKSISISDISAITQAYAVFGTGNAREINLYNMFLVKEDNWQEWISKAGLSTDTYATLDSVLSDSTALETLMNNKEAVNYMLLQCTGTVIASVIQSETALTAINNSPYSTKIYANEHWAKFLNMVA